MQQYKNLIIHLSITVAAVIIVAIAANSGTDGDADFAQEITNINANIAQNADLIAENKNSIAGNQKKISSNKSDILTITSQVSSMARTTSSQLSALKSKVVSPSDQMAYVNDILGLSWVTRLETGHQYCLIPYPLPWHYAQDFARKVGGNLVIIEDEAENEWIANTFGSNTEFWIGLTDEHDEGKWRWVNGLDAEFKNWAAGEPDNYKQMQHHVILNKQGARGAVEDGKWNDITGNEIKIGIVEKAR